MFIPIIHGATRPGNKSQNVAKLVLSIVKEKYPEVETVLINPNDFDLKYDDDHTHDPRYTEITAKADAFIIVTPEYNHGYPGKLKTLLDSEFGNYKDKPVLVASVSNGSWGGARGYEALQLVLRALGMIILQSNLHFPLIDSTFDEQGNLLKPESKEYVLKSLQELFRVIALVKKNG